MKIRKFIILMMAVATLASCHKDKGVIMTLGTAIEPVVIEDDSKVYLGHAEKYLYWEDGDAINIFQGDHVKHECPLITLQEGDQLARFQGGPFEDDQRAYGFFPKEMNVSYSGSDWILNLPTEQRYRQSSESAQHPDSSFGKAVIPMVTYVKPGKLATEPMIFHVVGGILRLEFYGTMAEPFTIETIEFESKDKPIAGSFKIHDDPSATADGPETNIQSAEPILTANGGSNIITITDINKTIGGESASSSRNLFTFYLPLPVTTTGRMNYTIKVTLRGKQGGVQKQAVKILSANIHRSNLTMMPAVGISEVVASGNGTTTTSGQMIVGEGSKDRPFQIYTAEELLYIAQEMEKADGRINGQKIRGTNDPNPTYFKVVRSDISLVPPSGKGYNAPKDGTSVQWSHGIRNFRGIMYFSSSTAVNGGISNTSGYPLFETISQYGEVREIYVKGTFNIGSAATAFSPLCLTNNGTMIDCHNKCNVTTTTSRNIAGICVTNNGTLNGCANEGRLSTNGNVGGICYINGTQGTVQGNFSLSGAEPTGAQIGGICHTNNGQVQNCLVTANKTDIDATGNWGVIVYNNNASGKIYNCISSGVAVLSTNGSIGGICNTNKGDINFCSNRLALKGATGSMGGIAAINDGGVIYNCYTYGGHRISGNASVMTNPDHAGGIVGYHKSGKVYNCYNTSIVESAIDNGGIVGLIDYGADIQSCWTIMASNFYGRLGEEDDGAGGTNVASIGPFCFTRSSDVGCNHIGPSNFAVTAMINPDLNEYEGGMLANALNAWTKPTDGRTYYSWQQDNINNAPTFATGAKSKNKRKR